MSAAEILKQVKALSPRQRERFFKDAFKLRSKTLGTRKKKKPVVWPDIEARAKRIFGNRIMPNAVLLEREESNY